MHKVKLVVRYLFQDVLAALYVHQLELPFVPQIGMKFEQGMSTWLWETTNGEKLNPPVDDVIYDIDEEELICLFTVEERLASAFWEELSPETKPQRIEFKYV